MFFGHMCVWISIYFVLQKKKRVEEKTHIFVIFKNSTGVKYFYTGGMFHVQFSKAISESAARLWFMPNWGVAINQWKALIHCAYGIYRIECSVYYLPRIDA